MKWFNNWFAKKCKAAWEDAQNQPEEAKYPNRLGTVRESEEVSVEGLRFCVMSAQGGIIVQTRQYDKRTDRSNLSTHIIPDGDNIQERIAQIVSLELLRS